jgi:hypothetical protein
MTEPPAEPSPPGLVVVIDALDSALLAEFWSSALRYEQQGSVAQFRVLVPPGSDGPVVLIQQVQDTDASSNRVHLDLHVSDRESETRRLMAKGARRLRDGALEELRWITMADPEGNVFDIVEDPPVSSV